MRIKKSYYVIRHNALTYDLREVTIDPDGKVTDFPVGNPDIYENVYFRAKKAIHENMMEPGPHGRERKGTKIQVIKS